MTHFYVVVQHDAVTAVI